MALSKEALDELLKGYSGSEELFGSGGLIKQLTKALIERAMEAELTNELGYSETTSKRHVALWLSSAPTVPLLMESIAIKSLSLPRNASANGDLPPFLSAAHVTKAQP